MQEASRPAEQDARAGLHACRALWLGQATTRRIGEEAICDRHETASRMKCEPDCSAGLTSRGNTKDTKSAQRSRRPGWRALRALHFPW
jgi:hypothetical protein